MAILIRRAVQADVPAITSLWRGMWAEHGAQDPRFETSPMAGLVMPRAIQEHLAAERSEVLVAEDGSRVVGFVVGTILENPPLVPQQFYGYLSELAVEEKARRKGVGRRLVDAVHAWFRSRGLPYAQVQVPARSKTAGMFWRKQGYAEFVEQLRTEL